MERGLARSRAQARDAILRGGVSVDGVLIKRPAHEFPADAEIRADVSPFASRGGLKLDHALSAFDINVAGADVIDVGASTGGFTDVLLRRGASRVIALDVGRDQLMPEIAADPRVTVIDGVNARHLCAAELPFVPDFAVFDVSFISIQLVLPPVVAALAEASRFVALIKPQFEVGREQVGKGGIVRDGEAAEAAVVRVERLATSLGFRLLGRCPSPIEGGDGNTEYLIAAQRAQRP